MIITLTMLNGETIDINVHNWNYITKNVSDGTGSIIYFSLQDFVKVKETPQEICAQVDYAIDRLNKHA